MFALSFVNIRTNKTVKLKRWCVCLKRGDVFTGDFCWYLGESESNIEWPKQKWCVCLRTKLKQQFAAVNICICKKVKVKIVGRDEKCVCERGAIVSIGGCPRAPRSWFTVFHHHTTTTFLINFFVQFINWFMPTVIIIMIFTFIYIGGDDNDEDEDDEKID